MRGSLNTHESSSLRGYLSVLRRGKWMIMLAVVVVPAAALGFSFLQQHKYQGTATVLLSQQNLASSLTGIQDFSAQQSAERQAQTQAQLAATPTVAARTLRSVGLDRSRTAADFLAASSVSTQVNADLLDFTVTDGSPSLAARLATAYAQAYSSYRLELDSAAIISARQGIGRRIAQLKLSGDRRSALYASLVDKDQQLRTLQVLQTANVSVVRTADTAVKVQPKPVRNVILGLILGLVLGLGLAFLRETLDTRVMSAEEISQRLGLPLLGRLAHRRRAPRNSDRLIMVAEPSGMYADAFRMLRANLEFVNLELGARTIMVTSAVQGEGKSTTAANLAVALARAGRHVVLVDLDLREPSLDKLFNLKGHPGLTQVVSGHAELETAIVTVALSAPSTGHPEQNEGVRQTGLLEVVGSGPIPPNPGEFIVSAELGEVLAELALRGSIMLVDTPPLLGVGDALALSARVDAVLLVTRLKVVRRPMLKELRRLLDGPLAPPLGFVLTGAELEEGYGHGYGYGYGYGNKSRPEDDGWMSTKPKTVERVTRSDV